MKILALSTSGPCPSACVLSGGAVWRAMEPAGRTHSETIMGLCERVLCDAGLSIRDMDAFAADIGPGSFTGVRIGVSAVNAFGAVCEKPVLGVSAPEALLFEKEPPCFAILDARNGNAYAMSYGGAPEAVTLADWLALLPESPRIYGDAAPLREAILAVRPAAQLDGQTVGAEAVARIALRRIEQAGLPARTDFSETLPLYLRPSQAERLFEQRYKT